jgi:glycosyltransferase involved in cell wall biosynthesis
VETRKPSPNPAVDASTIPGLATDVGANAAKHICVCVCTYKRAEFLRRLLGVLARQDTGGLFTYSVVVADNDHSRSAEAVVSDFAAALPIPIRYCMEPRQNIALARNKAVENATGDFVAFIDDDEFPTQSWLLTLFKTCNQYGVDGVVGPVKPHFEGKPPTWVLKSKLYERLNYPTGFVIDGTKGRTGNVLLRRELFAGDEEPFRAQFRFGEDQDFFRRMIEKGYVFIWCDEAVAYESVPPARCKRSFMWRRGLLRGASSLLHPTFGVHEVVKSLIAVPAYTAVLPLSLLVGQGPFMICSVKLLDHLGRLLALLGIHPVKEAFITD